MANIWACFCLAFTASYTANLGERRTSPFLRFLGRERGCLCFLAAFMITKEIYFDLSGINDFRVGDRCPSSSSSLVDLLF